MKKIVLLLVLFGLFIQVNAQRNYTAKKLLFSHVQKPYINYGYLYNWWAAIDSRKISSSDDWTVPSQADLITLQSYAGGQSVSGGKLKQTNFIYWQTPNIGATNEFGFNARGAGGRSYADGTFYNILLQCLIWSSTEYSTTDAIQIGFGNNTASSSINSVGNPKKQGSTIRLIYTGTGNPTSYTGNDGKIYRVITINGVTYTADNLAETLYRDGSTIPVVTDNAAWAALTTGARCVYNNDESYR